MSKIGHNGGPVFQSDAGFVAIFRAMRSHPIVGFHLFAKPCDANKGAVQPALAFIDLIMECRYEDGFVTNGGRKMDIGRGQLVGAVSWLAARWNWTPMAVRVWLDKLEADGMISRSVPGDTKNNKHKGKVATVITLCNYDQYQSSTANEQHTKQQTNSKQATNEQQQYKDNKETTKQITTTIGASDFSQLEAQLLGACNGALDNPANCSGLLSLAIPQMWMAEGADLQLDILPTLKAVGQKAHGKRINTWNYFTRAVAEAKATRLAGLPTVEPRKTKTPMGSDWAEIAKKAREQEGRR